MSGDIDVKVDPVDINIVGLDNIGADIDLGLNDINLALKLEEVKADIRSRLTLDEVRADVKSRVTLDEIRADVKSRVTLDEVKADIKSSVEASLKELAPIIFSFLWKEIPIVRIGFPHRYRLCFTLCGKEVLAISLCGESEFITERNNCPDECVDLKGGNDGHR